MLKIAHLLFLGLGSQAVSIQQHHQQVVLGESTSGVIEDPGHSSLNSESAKWACRVRGWVRAPDLSPSSVTPGEARLAINGSSCDDIAGWAVGLRFKERAIVKLKNPNMTSFPVKPTRKPWNETRFNPSEFDDIFKPSSKIHWDMDDQEYRDALDAYNRAIEDRKLWDVEGVERQVFDVIQELPFEKTVSSDAVDTVKPFWVHMPNTNLPPMGDRTWGSDISSDDEQLLNAESLFEYYLKVTLKNGTILDIPAGQTSFKPQSPALPAKDWPSTKSLPSPRLDTSQTVEDEWGLRMPGAPDCDKDALALFNITVKPTPDVLVQGGNYTLDITLTRQGNGTEYPSVLNVFLNTEKELDWAKTRKSVSGTGNESLQLPERKKSTISRINDYRSGRMLTIKPMKMLEKQRKAAEEDDFGAQSGHFRANRTPLRSGQGRYDFEELEEEPREVYNFQVDLQVPYDALPSFNGTFYSFHPQVRFNLHTVFLCSPQEGVPEDEEDLSASALLDKQWIEAVLPVRNRKARSHGYRPGLLHSTTVEVDVKVTSEGTTQTAVHYTDSSARGPIITLAETTSSSFPVLNHQIRKEDQSELLKSRYGGKGERYGMCGSSRCNSGGESMHAAKLWQEKEILEKGLDKEEINIKVGGKVDV